MYFTQILPILITGIFAVAMTNRLMTIPPPFRQAVVDAILIRIHQNSRYNRRTNHGADSFLFHILHHLNGDLSATLNHPEYRGFLFIQRTASATTFQTVPSTFTVFSRTLSGCPLCPAST
uniref:Uncharacterized protein n=1 Tax=Candidatus Kentrum eta TaxID=2126337 RepID=A0A450UPU4_9GAMM|nr:MAG: hypothetical protein BECKH772A_GA0070896_1007314 [Candidatus Kentron sp. H]VFJ95572.1 MAG: hypothetical protein BECKH772B_GA0070898_1007714 [Candidatus Kentron sp. H]VFK01785.1 MAG: hypothetical protein BECKH772C_GA0070978_1007214 [Candidatus Kentron sp. H]